MLLNYLAYKLTDISRRDILDMFPPKYPVVKADHITFAYGVRKDHPYPQSPIIEIIGYSSDGNGIEALVVSVNGIKRRPDGHMFHITLSLDPEKEVRQELGIADEKYQSVHSNALISKVGYQPLQKPIKVYAVPVFVPIKKDNAIQLKP